MKKNWRRSRAVVVSPDKESGLLIYNDAEPDFDLITFSYDGSQLDPLLMNSLVSKDHYAFQSEMWGQSFHTLCGLIGGKYDVVCFMNSDLYVGVSSLNNFFELFDLFELDFAQPSLSANSYISHNHTLNVSTSTVLEVQFIEIMMPCLSSKVINEINRIGMTTISGWGLDCYLFPYIQKKLNLRPPAVIHACQVMHIKPVSSNILYSDGLTAQEQANKLRDLLNALPH